MLDTNKSNVYKAVEQSLVYPLAKARQDACLPLHGIFSAAEKQYLGTTETPGQDNVGRKTLS